MTKTAAKTAAPTKPDAAVILAPIAKVDVAEENARFGVEAEDVDELAASIRSHGVLQPLLAYDLKGRFKVFAGARRLAALQQNGAAHAPIMLRDRAEARALSVVENDQRRDMHPADEAKAWAAMLAKNIDAKAIAAAHGKSERFVLQRVALAHLADPIFKAFAADEIDLALAQAYAIAPADRQLALWKRLGKGASTWQVRHELGKGKLKGNDKLARFVGRDAYLAAGGRIEGDLFDGAGADDDDFDHERGGFWLDRKIVDDLAAKKVEAISAKLTAEGWSFVHFAEAYWGNDYVRVQFKTGAKEAKAKAGCLISIERSYGESKSFAELGYEIIRGVAKRGSAASKAPALKPAKKTKPGEAPAAELAAPPITNTAHEQATRIASRIVGREIGADFDFALIAMTAQLVRLTFGRDFEDDDFDLHDARVVQIEAHRVFPSRNDPFELISDEAHQHRRDAWAKRLPKRLDASLESWLRKLPDIEDLFAFCVGEQINHVEQSPKDDDDGRAVLQQLGQIAAVDVALHWSPPKEWLTGLSRDALDDAARAVGVTPAKTKGGTAEAIAAAAADKGWSPPLLLELTGAAVKPPAAKKKAAKKAA